MVLDCVDFDVVLKDSFGDGWDGNDKMHIGNYSMTLESGFEDTATICLTPGIYSPYVCNGDNEWYTEISWEIYNSEEVMVLSGASINKCNASWGNFTVDANDGVRNPTSLCFAS